MIPSLQEKIVKARQQAGGPDPVQRQNPSKKTQQTRPVVGGTDPILGRIPLQLMVGRIDPTPRMSLTSVDMGDRADQERCIPIPRWTRIRLEAAGTWQMDIAMAVGVQQTRDRLVATWTRYSGDNLNTRAIHPSQWKTTKRQRTRNRPMVVSAQGADYGPRAEPTFILSKHDKWVKVW